MKKIIIIAAMLTIFSWINLFLALYANWENKNQKELLVKIVDLSVQHQKMIEDSGIIEDGIIKNQELQSTFDQGVIESLNKKRDK